MSVSRAVVAGLVVTQLALLVTSVYLHRCLAHRALCAWPPAAYVMRALIWVTTGMRQREWVAVHRRHHALTDTLDDPHSPGVLGFWRVQLTNAALYRRAVRDGITIRRYARDLPPDRCDRLVFDHGLLGLGIGIGILCLTLGWRTGLLAAGIHAVSYVTLSGAINAVGHSYGRRPHDNMATNLRLLALVTSGEALHNNHHAAPTSARFARTAGELDPGWWTIRALERLRLVTLRKHRTQYVSDRMTVASLPPGPPKHVPSRGDLTTL
jgi:stearoyl-CoA desaturase (delta-9 desaturase)